MQWESCVKGIVAGRWQRRWSARAIVLALGVMPALAMSVRDAAGQAPAQSVGRCGESSASNARAALTVCRAAGAIEVDGQLDDPGWREAARIELPFEIYPGNNSEARVATACLVTFDDQQLFLACRAADDDPRGIRAFYAPRDELDGQDRIGFVLDPFNDARRAFQFVVTPLGVQADGVYEQVQGGTDDSWDAIWHSAGRLTDTGYAVEIAIPFKSLRFPRTEAIQTWGFYMWRLRPRSEDVETRSVPLDRGNGCLLCQAGLLAGLHGIAPGRNIQLSPTLTGSRADARTTVLRDALVHGELGVDAGIDAQWSPSSNLVVAATINPDFSQVEADVAQLDVNNRFTLFFPEKRPFFLEGAELHSTPMEAVFTRTISNPSFGARVAGKVGGTAVGLLVAGDRVTNLLLPANQGSSTASVDDGVTSVITRVRRDVGASSTLGLLYTGREGSGYHNRVVGADGFLQPLPPVSVRLQMLRSYTDYQDGFARGQGQRVGGFTGNAALAQVNYNSRTWRGQALGQLLDAGFRADAGFIEQVDVREINAWGQRQFWGSPGGWLARFNVTGGFWTKWRSDDLHTERVFWGNLLSLGPELLRVFLDYQHRRGYFQGAYYALNRYRAEIGIAPTGGLEFSIEGRTGDAIDLANAERVWQAQLGASARLRIGRHLDVDLSHDFERLSDRGTEIVTGHLPQARVVVNLSRQVSLRANAQYRVTDRNPAAFTTPVEPSHRHLFGRLLFAYEANPQTLFYLGYTDDRDGLTQPDGTTVPAAAHRTGVLRQDELRLEAVIDLSV